MNRKLRQIRKQTLAAAYPLDADLLEICEGFPTHNFLQNPAGQNVYLYLTQHVKTVSEYHFDKSIDQLKILDWGSGKGHVTFLLRKLGASPVSCDVRDAAGNFNYGQAMPIVQYANIAIEPLEHEYILPFESASLDVVLSFGVLEHVRHDFESLKEIHRVLSSRGLFFCFNLPYCFSWTQRLAHLRGNYYHDRLYRKGQVRQLLQASQFDLLDLWHRQLLPKNSVRYPAYQLFETIDQFLTEYTPLKYLATNIEFVAAKA